MDTVDVVGGIWNKICDVITYVPRKIYKIFETIIKSIVGAFKQIPHITAIAIKAIWFYLVDHSYYTLIIDLEAPIISTTLTTFLTPLSEDIF